MNERRRFLQVMGSSALAAGAAGAGCGGSVSTGPGGTTTGTGGGGTGGGGTGGGTGGSTASSTAASSSSTGGMCGTGGAANQGSNNDFCQSNKGRFAVGKPTDYPTMGFNKVTNTNASILMMRDAGGLYALSSWCTHQCCDMNDVSPQGPYGSPTTVGGKPAFRCNCHGSKFLADGSVAQGPAGTPLAAFELSLGCDGVLYVDTGKTVPSSTRLMA